MPPVSSLTAFGRWPCIASRSSSALDLDAQLGHRAIGRGVIEYSDAWSIALDGMQPTLRQVPPSVSRLSAQAVLRPSCAARIAAT